MPKTDAEKREIPACPTCGQRMPEKHLLPADALLHVLKTGIPHRQVYRGQDGSWWVTHGGGETTRQAVQQLLGRGSIVSVYNSIPDEVYHVGRTWDYERTMAARKRLGKNAPQYYVGDPPDTAELRVNTLSAEEK